MYVTVGHVPLEVSKLCYFFMQHGGRITGKVFDTKRRLSPIPSGGLEIKLQLTFTGQGDLSCKMKRLLTNALMHIRGTTPVSKRIRMKTVTIPKILNYNFKFLYFHFSEIFS